MVNIAGKISRREFLNKGAAAAGLLAAGLAWPDIAPGEDSKRPNILFILTDDHRWDAMSCMGHPFLKTPNMDRIASEGAMFDNAFATTSLCSPSRASFLTGTYAHRHGVVTNENNDPDPSIPIFPQVLQKAGYETAYVGKWHMARKADPRPGFDYWLSFVGQGVYTNPKLNENGREFQAEGYMTDILTDYAVNWLKQKREKPFCMVLAHKAVHGPFTPAPRHENAFPDASLPEPKTFNDSFKGKPKWYRRNGLFGSREREWSSSIDQPVPESLPPKKWNSKDKDRLNYYRALLAVDESIGQVMKTLEEAGELDNTVIIFAGDNGFFMGEHGRGDKRLIYEESIRIPFLMRYPKMIKPGTHIRDMVLNIDLAPTLIDLAGASIPDTVQGESMVRLFKGNNAGWRKSFFYSYFRENWLPGLPLMHAVRTEEWKYACYPDIEDIDELYNLKQDPYEIANLSQDPAYAAVVRKMREELERLKKETKYPEGKHPGAGPDALVLELRPDKSEECVLHLDFNRGPEDISGKGNKVELRGARVVEEGSKKVLEVKEGFVEVRKSKALDPSRGPWTVEVRFKASSNNGVILAHGGENHGYSLYLKDGVPHFTVRTNHRPVETMGKTPVGNEWTTLTAVIGSRAGIRLYQDGKLIGRRDRAGFVAMDPHEGMQIGTDAGTCAGPYTEAVPFSGLVEYVQIWAGDRIKDE